jgi:hypothetical protein
MSETEREYAAKYRKPPVHTRFNQHSPDSRGFGAILALFEPPW